MRDGKNSEGGFESPPPPPPGSFNVTGYWLEKLFASVKSLCSNNSVTKILLHITYLGTTGKGKTIVVQIVMLF